MEMLDHLLEGQQEGKTAKDIFGEDPRGFAEELIEQLPREKKRELIPFIGGIIADLLGWFLVIRSVLFLVLSRFTEVSTEVYTISVLCIALVIAGFVALIIVYIFKLIEKSLFNQTRTIRKDSIKAGIVGAIGMAGVLVVVKFTPDLGPSFDFPWWASFLIGAVLLGFLFVRKKLKRA